MSFTKNSSPKGRNLHPIFAAVCLVFAAQAASAQSLKFSEAIGQLLEDAPRTQAAKADLNAAQDRLSEVTRRAWAPQLELNASGGYQRYEKPNAEVHDVNDARSHSVRITQLITDFGRSSKNIEENQKVREQTAAGLEAMKQGIALDGLLAYMAVQRADQVLDFARRSEKNIMEQAKIEDAMVEAGRGYVSNVLQAKAQLAGAQARRVRAEGAQSVAQYRVQAVFGDVAKRLTFTQAIPLPSQVPGSLQLALQELETYSLQVKIGQYRSQALAARADSVRAREYAPRLQFVLEARRPTASDGVMGTIKDDRAQLQLSYPFNLGFAGSAAVSSATNDLTASTAREAETLNLVREQVSISWRNLQTAQENRSNLQNQVRLAQEFLNIAKQERAVGKRSLLDVLSAETNLLNAQSDLVSTEFDVLTASYTLLQAIGRLNAQTLLAQFPDARS